MLQKSAPAARAPLTPDPMATAQVRIAAANYEPDGPEEFSAAVSQLRSEIASTGQMLMQLPQRMHSSLLIQM